MKPSEISNLINFRTHVKEELFDLELKLLEIQPVYDWIRQNEISDEIKEGSRVVFDHGFGNNPVQGRVIAINKGKYSVHRDGFVGTINAQKSDLTNLSTGIVAELERKVWVLERRIARMNWHLQNAEIPDILLINRYNLIHVINVNSKTEISKGIYEFITFIHSLNKQSYQLKINQGLITEIGYYQLEIESGDIRSILKSTKETFESKS